MNLDFIDDFSIKIYELTEIDNKEDYAISPLGIWISLAYVASSCDFENDEDKAEVEALLGVSLEDIPEVVKSFKEMPNTTVTNAIFFASNLANNEKVKAWLSKDILSDKVELNIPDKKELDSWVEEKTEGLLTSFPADEDSLAAANVVATNILYSDFTWGEPYESVENSLTHWGVKELLLADSEDYDTNILFYDLGDGNIIGALVKSTQSYKDKSCVISVVNIGESNCSQSQLLEAAHKISRKLIKPLEVSVLVEANNLKIETVISENNEFKAYTPAWDLNSLADLSGLPELKTSEISAALIPGPADLIQSVRAKYSKTGFEAAAVTSFLMRGMSLPEVKENKRVTLFFDRPFVALALDKDIPAFACLVHSAVEA